MTKFYALDDEDCTIDEVNEALKEAGFEDVEIFYDPANNNNISISHRCYDSTGHVYYQDQRTGWEAPYWFARDFESDLYRKYV